MTALRGGSSSTASVSLSSPRAERFASLEAPGVEAQAPSVSIVLNFLNEARFLAEAIESVLSQTYDSWELILVDDGSVDGSTAIAQGYAARDPDRIRYLAHPQHANRGTSASRNAGMAIARGELIAFLDGDDVWLPHKLEEQVRLMGELPDVALLYGRAENWYSWTGAPEDAGRDTVVELGVEPDRVLAARALLKLMLPRKAAAPWPSGLIVRRSTAEMVGGFEEAFKGMYDDQVFVAKVNIASPVYAADRLWHRYRQRPDSVYAVARATGKKVESRLKYLEWLTGYLREQGIEPHALTSLASTELQKLRNPGGSWWSRRSLRASAKALLHAVVPPRLHARAVAWWRKQPFSPPPGRVDFGDFRRLSPISRRWGKDRLGMPIDRYYIDRFLQANSGDIRGRVLEVGDSTYSRRFGSDAVVQIDVLHTVAGDPAATLVGDLCTGDGLPTDAFDCVILTQVLHVLPDPAAAVRTLQRILKPGGVVLASVPGISQVSRWDTDRWGDYWRCTEMAVRHLFAPVFPPDETTVSSHGNVLVAAAFLYGLADSELRKDELDQVDPDYPLILTVRAALPSAKAGRGS